GIGVVMSLRPPILPTPQRESPTLLDDSVGLIHVCPREPTMDDANKPETVEPRNSSDSSDPVVVAVIPKNKADDVIISLCRYNGHDLIDVRVYSAFNGVAEKRPTRKGVCVNVALLPALIAALNAAAAEAHRLGLLTQAAPDQSPVNG